MSQMDSADKRAGVARAARLIAASCVGELPGTGLYPSSSLILCLLIASACLLGGPRRRLGRLNVQGISRAAQDLHGGPLSSHYETM